MKKILLITAFFMALVTSFACDSMADEAEQEYNCCCVLLCNWGYEVLNGACVTGAGPLDGTVETLYSDCIDMQPDQESTCESEEYAKNRCETTRGEVWNIVNEDKNNICPQAQFALIGSTTLLAGDYQCDFGPTDECSSSYLLGDDDVRLDVLKQFRDEVLSRNQTGRMLTGLYYEYSVILIEVFDENPALKAEATGLLEKIIPLVQTILEDDGKGLLFTDEVLAGAVNLLNGIDAVMASPLKKTLLGMKRAGNL